MFSVYPDFLPDGIRLCGLGTRLECDESAVLTRKADCFVAEVEDFDASAFRPLCHAHRDCEVRYLRPGQKLAVILAYRRRADFP